MAKRLLFFLMFSGISLAQTTSNFKFNIPATGTQINTWGPLNNANFICLDTLLVSGGVTNCPAGAPLPHLIAGTNITITGTWPNQTITAIGGASPVTSVFGMTGAIANLSGDVSTSGSSVTTLATVNSNVGSFTAANITVNAKGQVTAAANGSGGTISGLTTNTIPKATSSTTVGNSLVTDDGTNLAIAENARFKGPNPYFDVTAYGARTVAIASIPNTTASVSASGTAVTLAAASTFQNGDGVVIYGAGATNVLTTPDAPTVVPSQPIASMGSGQVVSSGTGAVAYQYQVVARDKNGGLTAASSATAIANGLTVGRQSISVTSFTRSNNTTTVITATAHTIAVGSIVYISGASSPSFGGYFIVASAADNTHFTFLSGEDTRAGSPSSGTGGTVAWFQANHITWDAVTDAWQYYIYGRASGSMALIGVARPGELAFDDYGATISAAPVVPSYVPNTPPVSATNDYLSTTISSGAGTTSIVVANAATNTVSGAVIKFDDVPGILAAAAAALNKGVLQFTDPGSGSGLAYIVNSFLGLTSYKLNISQKAKIYLNETMEVPGQMTWEGDPGSSTSSLSFAWNPGVVIGVNSAFPGIYQTNTAVSWSNVSFEQTNNNGVIYIGNSGGSAFNVSFEGCTFEVGASSTDYMGLAMALYGTANNRFDHTTFIGSSVTTNGITLAPLVLFMNDIQVPPSGNGPGSLFCDFCYFNQRGVGVVSIPSAGSGIVYRFQNSYEQGGIQPLIATATQGRADWIWLDSFTSDTSQAQIAANWGGTSKVLWLGDVAGAQSGGISGNIVTGNQFATVQSRNSNIFGTYGQSRDTQINSYASFKPPTTPWGGNNPAPFATIEMREFLHFPAQHAIYFDLASPTSPAVAVAAGGSMAPGTNYYGITSVGFDGGESALAVTPTSCVTSGGDLTCNVSWTAVAGAAKYNVYKCGGNSTAANCYGANAASINVTTNSYSDTTGGVAGAQAPANVVGSGLTTVLPAQVITPSLLLSSPLNGNQVSFSATVTPGSLTANRTLGTPDASGTASLASVQFCGTTTTCAKTVQTLPIIVYGTVALSSGTPSTATLTALPFTGTSSYVCTGTNQTTATNNLIKFANASATSTVITGPNTITDVIGYQCMGN